MLLFAWYINRGLVRHTVEDSFTRNVVVEYGAFAAFLIFLFVVELPTRPVAAGAGGYMPR